MDDSTLSTAGPACDAANNEQAEVADPGSQICCDTCTSSADCATNLFCCPNSFICMDITTRGAAGPNCDAHRGEGELVDSTHPDPTNLPGAPTSWAGHSKIGDREICEWWYAQIEFGYYDSIDECAARCLNLGSCFYFLYDPNDGQCLEQMTEDGCQDERVSSQWYDLYELNCDITEPTRPDGAPAVPDVAGLPYV